MIVKYSDIVSTLALLVSVVVGAVLVIQFQIESLDPEINVKLDNYRIERSGATAYSITADITFAITNRSSRAIYVSGCKFENERAVQGRGGWERNWSDCSSVMSTVGSDEGLHIKAGQTRFFDEVYQLEVSDQFLNDGDGFEESDLANSLLRMGIELDDESEGRIFASDKDDCDVAFRLRPQSAGFGGNCRLKRGTRLFNLIVQTTGGELIRETVRFDYAQDWPWETELSQ